MTTVYLIRCDDLTSNACRSTHNPSSYYLTITPLRNNASPFRNIKYGHIDTVNNVARTSVGRWDIDNEQAFEDLLVMLLAENCYLREGAIYDWLKRGTPVVDTLPLAQLDACVYYTSCKLNLAARPVELVLKEGWQTVAMRLSGEYGSIPFPHGLNEIKIRLHLNNADIGWDEINEILYTFRGRSGVMCFNVQTKDYPAAYQALAPGGGWLQNMKSSCSEHTSTEDTSIGNAKYNAAMVNARLANASPGSLPPSQALNSSSPMYLVIYSFGSPFAGQVCDDGPSYQEGPFDLETARQVLVNICDAQRCIARVATDRMSATFANANGSTTGTIRVELVKEDATK